MSSSKQEENERSCLTVLKREPDGALPNSFRTFRALANYFRTVWSLSDFRSCGCSPNQTKTFGMRRVLTHVLEHSSHKCHAKKKTCFLPSLNRFQRILLTLYTSGTHEKLVQAPLRRPAFSTPKAMEPGLLDA